MATHYMGSPVDNAIIEKLHVGDKVIINGVVYTARDAAHKRLINSIQKKEKPPFDLKGQIIYYTGPCPAPPDKIIGSAGPTTSGRMDPFTPTMIENGIKVLIGKGKRDNSVVKAIKKHNAVYLATIGGAGAYLAKKIASVQLIAYPELGPEAIYRLELINFPCFVAIDSKGNNIYNKF
ncbi:Fumarate hydratase class I, beta region [Candidatus Syntrophocurvum alkaliphilum]|uniref:Fumarate hydratase class I, beta region n=1 Tax=Candidatus Syntrophocurvum alkaliphilum TaxID=2293317 RepID=A0A6I6D6I6_9FIRM|nr:FumA C-terminus/TtdB family hydratase beta subunit [Candidatus Syntrophocurvum alkaliphilum]QGT98876.1 Fumarate hydratase class I, beta region [Candidatus Syntrophocurvum alkaliphilum]